MPAQVIQYLKTFRDVCNKINSSLNIKEVLKAITENTVKKLNVKGCTTFLLDRTGNKSRVIHITCMANYT